MWQRRTLFLSLLSFMLVLGLAGCGRRGALELPPGQKSSATKDQEPSPNQPPPGINGAGPAMHSGEATQ